MSLYERTEMLLTPDGVARLKDAHVAVFGLGGVGGYAAEALARAGVGRLLLVDGDVIRTSNINRQIVALHSTLGQNKAEVMAKRIRDINPAAEVEVMACFYMPDNEETFTLHGLDYIVDAVDMVTAKLALAVRAQREQVPIISSMGAGNKLDPAAFEVADLFDTSVCPLARVMRHELRQRGITRLKVVYSKERPITPPQLETAQSIPGKVTPGSVSFVPSVAGLILAGEVIKDIAQVTGRDGQ